MEFRSALASVMSTSMVVGACSAWHLPQDLAAEQSAGLRIKATNNRPYLWPF